MNGIIPNGYKNLIKVVVSTMTLSLLAIVGGCSGGGGGGGGPVEPVVLSSTLSGGGVKGPLANASYSFYKFDPQFVNFQSATPQITGTTDAQAKFSTDVPTADISPPYIVVFVAGTTTIDLMTGKPPIISSMKTVVTQAMLDGGKGLYATPLTSMAVDVAIRNTLADREPYISNQAYLDATTVLDRFLASLPIAAQQVKSTLGFGLDANIDIYTASPIVNADTDTPEKLAETAQYRGSVEAFGAVVDELQKDVSGSIGSVDTDVMVDALVEDLVDGKIDGMDADGNAINVLPPEIRTTMENIDPEQLIIPGTETTDNPTGTLVSDIEMQLASETVDTGFDTVDTTVLTDPTAAGFVDESTAPAETDPDRDADGALNSEDAFPDDPSEQLDTDKDGSGNNTDADIDGDGTDNGADTFALNAKEWADTDGDCAAITTQTTTSGDGCGDNSDADIDGDGVANASDDFPFDASKTTIADVDGDGYKVGDDPDDNDINNPAIAFNDTDGDGLADDGGLNPDGDDDNDGVPDTADLFTLNATEWLDLDGDCGAIATQSTTSGDGCGNNSDTDIDGDGALNTADAFPFDLNESVDTDKDRIGNNADTDDDNDTVLDTNEAAGCSLKRDCDGDGRMDSNDTFPADATEWVDTDGDGTGNNADLDDDGDGVDDTADAYPLDPTRNAVVLDSDNDGIDDNVDNCPTVANTLQLDKDGDLIGNACDDDIDGDGTANADDAFPGNPDESLDTDQDGFGNNVDKDDDGDGVLDVDDAFPLDATETVDTDGDQTGNNADTDDDNDLVLDTADNCPLTANATQTDTDGDSMGDACDADDDNDTVVDTGDNCPLIANVNQTNTDSDAMGDACDSDDDNDTFADTADNCPLIANEQIDTDSDGMGDACDTDDDNDTVADTGDNCPLVSNVNQTNTDTDTMGDACDTDDDADGTLDTADNCPLTPNADQLDTDSDTLGDVCDNDKDGDTVANATDNCPLIPNLDQTDTSGNGIGDACDISPLEVAIRAGVYWYESDSMFDEVLQIDVTSYSYGNFTVDASDIGVETGYSYNPDALPAAFEIDTLVDDNILLSASGWISESTTVETLVFNTDGSATSTRTLGATVVSQSNVSWLGSRDMTNTSIAAFLAADGNDKFAAGINPTGSVFSTGSESYSLTETLQLDKYEIWCGNSTVDPTTGDTCHTVRYYDQVLTTDVYATTLAEMVEPATQNGMGKTVGIGETANAWVNVELVGNDANVGTSGTATYYSNPQSGGTPTALTPSGTWTVVSVNGQNLLEFTVPAAINDTFMYNDSPKRFLAVYDAGSGTAWLRQGNKLASGDVDGPFVVLNVAANADLIGSFDPSVISGFDINDVDGDGVANDQDAFVDDASRDTDTDGDGLADDVYIVDANGVRGAIDPALGDTDDDGDGVLDTVDNCPTINDPGNDPALCDNSGILGIHKITFTVNVLDDTSTGVLSNQCFDPNEAPGDTGTEFLSFTDAGNGSVNISKEEIAQYNGSTGAFTVSNSHVESRWYQSLNGGTGGNLEVTESINVTATIDPVTGLWSAASFNETHTGTDVSGDVLNCSRTESLTGSLDYVHSGTENYNGVYAVELESYENGFPDREPELAQLEVNATAGSIKIHSMDEGNDPSETVLSSVETSTFDKITGRFEIINDEVIQRDGFDGAGNPISSISCEHDVVNGFFTADPTTAAVGAVMMVVDADDQTREFNNTTDPAVCTSGQLADNNWQNSVEGYAKLLSTVGFTRTVLTNKIVMGIQSPPLKRLTETSDLWLQMLDAAGNELCSAPFSGKFVIDHRHPAPDATVLAFQGGPYGFINCNTTNQTTGAEVTNGTTYTARILDTGMDGTKEATSADLTGVNDVEVFSVSVVAEVVPTIDRFTAAPNRGSFSVNGAKGSSTQVGGVIPLYGYFNPSMDLPISWADVADGQTGYQVRVYETNGPVRQRFSTNGATFNSVITAGTIDNWDNQTIRVTAVNKFSPTLIALSHSEQLEIQAGLRGLINVETDHADPVAGVFQLYVEAGADGNIRNCSVMNRAFSCTQDFNTRLDMMSNTLTLDMTDDSLGTVTGTPSSTFTMSMQFGDSASGIVTSYPGASTGGIRVVSPELVARARATNSGEETLVTLVNPLPSYNTGTLSTLSGIALDTLAATSWIFWDDIATTNDFFTKLNSFVRLPLDNAPQKSQGIVSYKSSGNGGLGMFSSTETFVATMAGSVSGSPDVTFEKTLTPPVSVGEPVVAKSTILVNSTAVNTSTSTVPTALASATLNVQWTTVDTFPTTSVWYLTFIQVDGTGAKIQHAQIRTAKSTDGAGVTLFVNTTTNDWSADPVTLPTGSYQMNIRAENPANDQQAVSQSVFISVP